MAKKTDTTFEQQLFKAADKLRKNIDAAEYKYVVLGLVFIKYISETFNELHEKLEADEYSDPEERDSMPLYHAGQIYIYYGDWAKAEEYLKKAVGGYK